MNLKGEVMIKISNLKVKKGKKEILNIDGLDTENTKYLGIFGGNGAGKTTLAKCIIGMESFEGEIVKKFPNSNTQVVLQNNGYPFYAKVKDIIMLVLNVSSLEGEIIEFKNKYKDAYTVCYINSSATVKAHCDVSVTSSSALDILNSIENKQILFLPDRNLGEYIAENFKEKEFILWDGCCKYHNNIKINEIYELKEKYPNSKILVHPECQKQIRDIADYIGSTAGIINYATNNDYKDYIIATEEGILYELKKKNPDKNFYIPGGSISCVDMKKTTLNNLYDTLLNMKNEVILDESVSKNALKCLENMHSLAK